MQYFSEEHEFPGTIVRTESPIYGFLMHGFNFSPDEPTALIQWEGGPCAVLAPVQAFILKSLVNSPSASNWQQVDSDCANKLLIKAACDILRQASNNNKFTLVHIEASSLSGLNAQIPVADEAICRLIHSESEGCVKSNSISNPEKPPNPLNYNQFHSQLRAVNIDTSENVEAFYLDRIDLLRGTFGVLLFLYSVMSTKGLDNLRSEVSDPDEPLIDSEFGYGSQSLINLMITGQAVNYVWNNYQDIGGLKLRGISKQSEVGFLTLLEHHRYCEVGSFLKNPISPVWILGNETHLTVLFSFEKALVCTETPSEVARRVFKSFDPDGNNFIQTDLLQDVLNILDLVSEPEYVDIMRKKLDSENLGIILLSSFMDEFFSEETNSTPDTFTLFHYNGLPRSCPNNKVVYQEGKAVLLECSVRSVCESNPMLTCLQTRWPNIEILWVNGTTPSLN
ncbi:unnamed protein product [Bemisia tabaci]|uniref:Ubiquitin carboxyl-terminal hydrolase MINDY n=1 Tax=Bemisia tabaci TaxID=7038 RepID=A0A9P0C7W9_BEMTA|nr:unnamed protein product [Bemisia tabaci]